MNGLDLIELIVSATGLPKEAVRNELARLAQARSLSIDNLQLDHLRELLAAYLQETLLAQIENG